MLSLGTEWNTVGALAFGILTFMLTHQLPNETGDGNLLR